MLPRRQNDCALSSTQLHEFGDTLHKTGAIVALEVKSGGARYVGSQVTKDAAIAAGSATFSMGEKAVQAGVAGQATTGVITALKRVP
jgi:hypothetical protein